MLRIAIVPAVMAACLSLPASAGAERPNDPLSFFEGTTVSVSTVKLLMHEPYESRAVGTGKIRPDGALDFVQRVERAGHPTMIRRWAIKRTGPGRFSGTMNEALGPVTIDEVDGRYRFRFKIKGNMSAEQWLSPEPGWRSAKFSATVKKFGIKVGGSEGTIRKIG